LRTSGCSIAALGLSGSVYISAGGSQLALFSRSRSFRNLLLRTSGGCIAALGLSGSVFISAGGRQRPLFGSLWPLLRLLNARLSRSHPISILLLGRLIDRRSLIAPLLTIIRLLIVALFIAPGRSRSGLATRLFIRALILPQLTRLIVIAALSLT